MGIGFQPVHERVRDVRDLFPRLIVANGSVRRCLFSEDGLVQSCNLQYVERNDVQAFFERPVVEELSRQERATG